jgi:hypothetical protein
MTYKRFIRGLAVLIAPLVFLSLPALADQERSETTTAMTAAPATLALTINTTSVVALNNVSGSVKVTTSNSKIATASLSNGKVSVSAKATGTARITVRDSRTTLNISVTVNPAPAMTASTTNLTLLPGATSVITLSNVSGSLSSSSSNTKVATVTVSGSRATVTAKAAGSAKVTLKDSKTTLSITVTVSATAAMTANPASLSLIPGATSVITLSNVSGTLSSSSSNTTIATVAVSGVNATVTAKAVGAVQITFKDSKTTLIVPVSITQSSGGTVGTSHTLLAWNDLGMHCMDGDYSVFSILPPYNNLHAQLVDSSTNKLVTQGVTLTFESMADADGSVNSISSTKTNFWQYAKSIFGVDLPVGSGLTGNATASFTPQALKLDAASSQFVAEGIPITPYDDSGRKNPYPMVKVIARDATGKQLAQARVVLPVSDEMSCAACHASNSGAAAKPAAGWVAGETGEREYKLNILRLHDEKSLTNTTYKNALATKGFNANGLFATASAGKPILCASCHASNALPGTGIAGIKPLTAAIHSSHAIVKDATSGDLLDSINNRNACYQCHPGSETKCLRGVMGNAVLTTGKPAIDCQSCHGTMSNVGSSTRTGWLDQPDCQSCHHDGKREIMAVSATGILKKWTDTRYATNANVPAAGKNLYRFSKGHGGLQCEACHGATHAEYPSSHANDNVLSKDVQGREGTIGECASCHKTVPLTADKGPHGMHTIGSAWVKGHESSAKASTTACAYCHGADYRGSTLSTVKAARSFNADGKTVNFVAGQKVGCYDCHNGPKGD